MKALRMNTPISKYLVIFAALFSLVLFKPLRLSNAAAAIPRADTEVEISVPRRFAKGPFSEKRTLVVPRGLRVSLYASGLGGARFMAAGPDGSIYVSVPAKGSVLILKDKDGDGAADSVTEFAAGLDRPHGLAFVAKDLIVAETGRLVLLKDTDSDGKAEERTVITEDLPSGGAHWTRTVVLGPDSFLYVSAGSSCNVYVESDVRRASVMRFSIKGGKASLFARGLRNTVGLAFHPSTRVLWGVDNGRDLLGDDLPPEELNRIIEGADYGWPYCYGDRIPDEEFSPDGAGKICPNTAAPVVKMQAHSAPLGINFGHGLGFPPPFKDALFIAFHGSWNRSVATGYKVVAIPFGRDGNPSGPPADFVTGWLSDGGYWGRPVQPMAGPDGSLYISDDYAGAIYRVYPEKTAPKR